VTGEEEVRAPPALVYATSDTNSLIYLYTGNNKYCWIKMAMGLFSKVVSDKMSGLLKSDEPEKVPPSEKELKEEEKRKVAQKEAEDERKKKHIKEEYQREKVRQNIRDKYGIEKKQPTKKSDKQTAAMMEELRKEYGMDDEDAKELQNKMDKDAAERDAAKEKVEQKMEVRKMKKELKKDLGVDKCKQQ